MTSPPVTAVYRQGHKPPDIERAVVCKRFRVTPTLDELITVAVANAGVTLSEWMRDACIQKLEVKYERQ